MFDRIDKNGPGRAFLCGRKTPALLESMSFLPARRAPFARITCSKRRWT